MKRVYKPSQNKSITKDPRQDSKQPINATSSYNSFTADDIIELMSVIKELEGKSIEAVDCGDGLWEFLIDDIAYQSQLCPI